jgi:hypothetical protein
LKGTVETSILYGTPNNQILGYADSNYAADLDDRKSTAGYIFLVNGGTVSWISKKQNTVAKSTTEAEYMSLSQATCEAIWLRSFLKEMGYPQKDPLLVYGDNQGSIKLSKNPQFHNRT